MEVLIASNNSGKIAEIMDYMDDLPCTFLSLTDINATDLAEPEETEQTLEGNSLLKAKYYAENTGYMTLADDGGIFVDALHGAPGVHSARFAPKGEHHTALLTALDGNTKRGASFKTVLTLYDPLRQAHFAALGSVQGTIPLEPKMGVENWGYNTVFIPEGSEKSYAEFDLNEKHAHSHRGKALARVKEYLYLNYEPRDITAAVAVIINQEGQVLMNLRNDPVNKNAHRKWEFPGGSVDFGETVEECAVRETDEEAGYTVRPVRRLDYLLDRSISRDDGAKYHLFLMPILCEYIGGDGVYRDAEVLDSRWFERDDVTNHDLIDGNVEMWLSIRPAIEQWITDSIRR